MEPTPTSSRRPSTRTIPGVGSLAGIAPDTASLHTISSGSNETTVVEGQPMFYLEMNPWAPVTVVLIHILFSCHLEWRHIWPKLAEYHLLLPDLPCHSKSRKVCKKQDFSAGLCADHIAKMIREHAHDGRAHIVGLSTGGYVAIDLVRRYPDVVRSAMISGAWPLTGKKLTMAQHPRLVYAGIWSVAHAPGHLYYKVSGVNNDHQDPELMKEVKRNGSSRLARAGMRQSRECQDGTFVEIGKHDIRICMLGGAKQDGLSELHNAVKLLRDQSQGGEGSYTRAYMVRDAIHAWNVQLPSVFAKGIQCWIERQNMPKEFEMVPTD